jgi:cardiolipin synthase
MADVVDALARAAQRGVQCRALADAMGSKAFLRSKSARRLRDAGVELTAALPTGALRTLVARTDLRNHRKIVVIDDRLAYSGSQNLVDPRFFKQTSGVGEWVDAMARISGPAAASLDGVFRLDWSVETGSPFEAPFMLAEGTSAPPGATVQVVPSGPDLQPEAIHQLLLTAIYAARKELVMSTPYFVPDDSILTALLTAALRGVRVTLIVPARNDSLLVRHASVAHFDDLMTASVRIALFNGGLLHTKSLTIDGEMSVFGSVNLDMRSLWLNFEISLLVYDRDFTGRLRSLQNTYLRDSEWVDLDTWRCRPARSRFVANSCRLLSPLL